MPTDKNIEKWEPNVTRSEYDHQFEFIWVFMSEYSAKGARGAPTAVFRSKGRAEDWVKKVGLSGNLYRMPLDVSVTEYNEPINGDRQSILKHEDKASERYISGVPYLGYLPHKHFFPHNE